MANLTYIFNGQIVLETGILWDGAMVIADGKIQAIGKERELPCPAGVEKIDAQGAYVGPGFVDIHVHAGNDMASFDHPQEVAEYFLDHGHTAFLPTPFYSQNFKEIIDSILAVTATTFIYLIGGLDIALVCLLIAIILDYISGIIKAYVTKELSSKIGLKGILKKVGILLIVMLSVLVDRVTGETGAVRTLVIYYFVANEGLSILENLGQAGVPIPESIKKALKVLKKENK